MLEKNYLKNLLQKNGIKIGYLCSVLSIDRQKFDRWSEDDHPNNKVLRAAVKFALRYMLETRESEAKRIQEIEEAEQKFKNKMDSMGL